MSPPAARPARADRWARATAVMLLLAGVLTAATFRDYGSTWDERFQMELGEDVVAWFASGGRDARALSGGSIGNLHLYGAAFEAAAHLAGAALPFDPVDTRHLLGALVALLGAVGTALLARRLGGPRAGFLGAALLLTTPFWWGYGFCDSKDIPLAAAYPWILLALLRASDELPGPRLGRFVTAGAALGAGLAVRPGGLIVLLPLAAGILGVRLVPVLMGSPSEARPRISAVALGRLAMVSAIGWLGMLALWPYGLRHPLEGPLAAVAAAQRFRWEGLVRFAGGWYPSTDLPRGYAPGWFLATLPETWFAIAALGALAAVLAWRSGRVRGALGAAQLDAALVAVAGAGPILATVVLRPVLYDGIRHLLFVLPALAALAGWALSAAVARLPGRVGLAALATTAGLAALAVVDAVRLHPYQYVYFNRLVAGGLAAASRDYELDYWGATGREAIGWVVRNVQPPPGRRLTVGTTADPSVAAHWIEGDPAAGERFTFERSGPPDIALATTRWFSHRATGRVLHVVERMGVPLLYVLDTNGSGEGLVLEAGDCAVLLPLPVGWYGAPDLQPGDERASYVLGRAGAVPAELHVIIATRRSGPVPDPSRLRDEVTELTAGTFGVGPATIAPQPVVGPEARGWIAGGAGANPGAGPFAGGAAVAIGDAAVVLLAASYAGDPEIAMREFAELARGVRLTSKERRVP